MHAYIVPHVLGLKLVSMQWPLTQVPLPCTVAGMPLMKMMTWLQRRALKNWSELTQDLVLTKYYK